MFKRGNITVRPKFKGEDGGNMIKRFMRKVKREGVLKEFYDRRYFEKGSVKRADAKRKRKRIAQKLQREQDKR